MDAGTAETGISNHTCRSYDVQARMGRAKTKNQGRVAKRNVATVSGTRGGALTCRTKEDFVPVSRFSPGELDDLIQVIESLPEPPTTSQYVQSPKIVTAKAQAISMQEPITIAYDEMSNELFDHLWSSEEDPYPFVVTDVTRYLQYTFSPEFFREYDVLGDQPCIIQNCETGEELESTVAEFFSKYGSTSEGRQVLRLKVNSLNIFSVLLLMNICIRTGRLQLILRLHIHSRACTQKSPKSFL
jgi:hypothetical protein